MTEPTNAQVLEAVEALRRDVAALRAIIMARAGGPLADEAELDSEHGDQVVKFDPHGWKGPSFKNKRMSACTPEYLDRLALAFLQMAAKEDREKKLYKNQPASIFTRKRAALARGWALRLRLGWTPTAAGAAPSQSPSEPSENPFESRSRNLEPAPSTNPFDAGPSPLDNDAAEPPLEEEQRPSQTPNPQPDEEEPLL